MPILSPDNRPSRKVVLPSSTPEDEAWVELYEKLLTSDMLEIKDNEDQQSIATLKAVTNCIKAWNFTNADGTPAPVDFDHVKFLDFDDFIAIVSEIKAFEKYVDLADDLKKKQFSSSTPKESVKTPTTQTE